MILALLATAAVYILATALVVFIVEGGDNMIKELYLIADEYFYALNRGASLDISARSMELDRYIKICLDAGKSERVIDRVIRIANKRY